MTDVLVEVPVSYNYRTLFSKESELKQDYESLLQGLIDYIVDDKLNYNSDSLTELLNDQEVKIKYAALLKEKIDILGLKNYSDSIKKSLKIEKLLITEFVDKNKHYHIKLFNDNVDYNITINPLNFIKLKLDMTSDIIFYLKDNSIHMEYNRYSEQKLKNKHILPKFRNEEKISEVDTYMSQYLSEQFIGNHFFSDRVEDLMKKLSKLFTVITMFKKQDMIDELLNVDLLMVENDFFDSLKLKYDFDIKEMIEKIKE